MCICTPDCVPWGMVSCVSGGAGGEGGPGIYRARQFCNSCKTFISVPGISVTYVRLSYPYPIYFCAFCKPPVSLPEVTGMLLIKIRSCGYSYQCNLRTSRDRSGEFFGPPKPSLDGSVSSVQNAYKYTERRNALEKIPGCRHVCGVSLEHRPRQAV